MVIKLGFQNLFAEVLVYRTSSLSGIQIIKTKIRSWSHLRQAEHGLLDILIMVDTRAEGIIFVYLAGGGALPPGVSSGPSGRVRVVALD